MRDEKRPAKDAGPGVDPPEAGRDRQRDFSPSFSHAVNASSHFREMLMDEATGEDWSEEMVVHPQPWWWDIRVVEYE